MDFIRSEGLENIGSIGDDGFILDKGQHVLGKITDSGVILIHGEHKGNIDIDGTIRDASGNTIGNIQANGYVYIHSQRVCHVSSKFIENITPLAANYGDPSSYSGRKSETSNQSYNNNDSYDSGRSSFFTSSFFIKIVIGVILGIIAWANGVGGIGMIIAGPIVVLLLSLIAKIFS